MIKFFRKIRQNLLMENKTGKYFKYAIGEIVLVVIGILIALSISNWNENRKNSQSETVFLEGILYDINEQKKLCNNQIDFESEQLKEKLQNIFDQAKEKQEKINKTKFFRIHNLIEEEHIRLNIANFLRFCPDETTKEKEEFRNYVDSERLETVKEFYKINHDIKMFHFYK